MHVENRNSTCYEFTTLPLDDTKLQNNKHHKPASHSSPSPHTGESCYMQHWRIPENICYKKSYFCCLRYFRPPWWFCNLRCNSADLLRSSSLRIHFGLKLLQTCVISDTKGSPFVSENTHRPRTVIIYCLGILQSRRSLGASEHGVRINDHERIASELALLQAIAWASGGIWVASQFTWLPPPTPLLQALYYSNDILSSAVNIFHSPLLRLS